jgi:hypothetical protein
MDALGQLYRVKEFIVAGVSSLPIILGGISLLLACSTANTGFAILTVCLALVVPFLTYILNLLIGFLPEGLIGRFANQMAGICKIVPGSTDTMPAANLPSYWMTSVIFFFTFVFMNGFSLYNFAAGQDASDDKVSSRKTHAIIGMISSAILLLLLIIWRCRTGCENWLGVILSLLFGGLGAGAFIFFDNCGLLRVVDLYGIGARLLPASATAAPTQVCFPVAK